MSEELFSTAERTSLDGFPDQINLAAFWLTEDDRAHVAWRRSDPSRLAAGVQIGALRSLGFVPDDLARVPEEAVNVVSDQIGLASGLLDEYRPTERTLRHNVTMIERHLGFSRCDKGDLKSIGDWLVLRAMEHDRPLALWGLVCDHLRSEQLVRPAVVTLERLIANARQVAYEETWAKLKPALSNVQVRELDALLDFDEHLGSTPLVWLCQQASAPVPEMVRGQVVKLERLRQLGIAANTVEALPANRVRHLSRLGQRHTPQALRRTQPERRYQIVACTLADLTTTVTDEVLELFDTALGTTDRRARTSLERRRKTSLSTTRSIVSQFGQIGSIVMNDEIPDIDLRQHILSTVGVDELQAAVDESVDILVPDSVRHLDELKARFSQLRQHSPHVLGAFEFFADHPDDELQQALQTLKYMNDNGLRRVPDGAPVGFVPKKWRKQLIGSDGQIDRKTWEIALLLEARGALRGANLWVEGSRKFTNPRNYLLDEQACARFQQRNPARTATTASEQLKRLGGQLNAGIKALDQTLADGGSIRVEKERLIVGPLASEDNSDTEQARQLVAAALPEVNLIELLVEVNSWCGFLDQLTHAGNAKTRSDNHDARLLATIMANGCNLGIADMARSSSFTQDQLAWTQTWHLRTDTVAAANNAIVNYHHKQPLTKIWGTGTLSSSDGQRFPFAVRNPKARAMKRYFTGTGATVYTWTADHHIQYGTKVIPTTVREATYVLDAILDNETDLEIEEHTTDTAGYTDLVFGLFDLCGLRFSPRLRDLSDQRLWRLPITPNNTDAGRLVQHQIRPALIEAHWNDMQRVAATIRSGHTSASLLVARLQASARQNELTKAIQEYGRLIKTVSTLRYLHDDQHRRRIHRQLNKGESLHALRRRLFFANLGQLTRRRNEDQDHQAQCLTLLTNAVIAWNTAYLDEAIRHHQLNQDVAEHLAPSINRHIHLYGQYDFISPQPPPTGTRRPLNPSAVTQPQH